MSPFERLKLDEVQQRYSLMLTSPTYESIKDFDHILNRTTGDLERSVDVQALTELARQWLNRFEFHLNNRRTSNFLYSALMRCTERYSLPSVLKIIVADDRQAKLLACACMLRVAAADRPDGTPPSTIVAEILSQWSGKTVDRETTASLEKTVRVLYGPEVWDLYFGDTNTKDEFAEYLWVLGLPLLGIVQETHTTVKKPERLPFDLT